MSGEVWWHACVVEILIKGEKKLSKWRSAGTGFAIGPDLILTCLHVVYPGFDKQEDAPSQQPLVRIQLPDTHQLIKSNDQLPRSGGGATTARENDASAEANRIPPEACVLWPPLTLVKKGAIDAVVLRVKRPSFERHLNLRDCWEEEAQAESRAYYKTSNGEKLHRIWGVLGPMQRTGVLPVITSITQGAPDNATDWDGASGAPIITGSSDCVGIVVLNACRKRDELQVLPARAILSAPGFLEVVPPKKTPSELKQNLVARLKAKIVLEALNTHPSTPKPGAKQPEDWAEWLITPPFENRIKLLCEICLQSCNAMQCDLAWHIFDIATHAMPLWQWKVSPLDGVHCEVYCEDKLEAELSIASHECRPAALDPIHRLEQDAQGRDVVALGPIKDLGPRGFIDNSKRELCDKMELEPSSSYEKINAKRKSVATHPPWDSRRYYHFLVDKYNNATTDDDRLQSQFMNDMLNSLPDVPVYLRKRQYLDREGIITYLKTMLAACVKCDPKGRRS